MKEPKKDFFSYNLFLFKKKKAETVFNPFVKKEFARILIPTKYENVRVCSIRYSKTKEKRTGFSIGTNDLEGFTEIREIIPNSLAQNSGLKNKDILVKVGSTNIFSAKNGDIIKMIKSSIKSKSLDLFVFSPIKISDKEETNTSAVALYDYPAENIEEEISFKKNDLITHVKGVS